MGFTEVESLDVDNTVALGGKNNKTNKLNPTKAEGYYLGSKKTASKKTKSGFAYLHVLQTDAGKLGVWGKTDLDRKLMTVEPGIKVRITQSGKVATPNGDMYKFKVEQDSSDVIEVAALTEAEEVQDGEPAEEYSSSEEETAEEPEEEEQETVQIQSAARRAAVAGLLNKNAARPKPK